MKITRKQFEKAKDSLPQLQKAQDLVNTWEQAVASMGPSLAGLEVVEIEGDAVQGFAVKAKRKEHAT